MDPAKVPVVNPARRRLELRPAHEETDDVEAVARHLVPVVRRDRDDGRVPAVVLVVVAERIQVDAAKDHLSAVGVHDGRSLAAGRVQRQEPGARPLSDADQALSAKAPTTPTASATASAVLEILRAAKPIPPDRRTVAELSAPVQACATKPAWDHGFARSGHCEDGGS